MLGWITLLLFLGWNALMLAWVISAASVNNVSQMPSDAQPYAAAGVGLAIGFILIVWAAGAVVTGLLAMILRGDKVMVDELDERTPPIPRRQEPRI